MWERDTHLFSFITEREMHALERSVSLHSQKKVKQPVIHRTCTHDYIYSSRCLIRQLSLFPPCCLEKKINPHFIHIKIS